MRHLLHRNTRAQARRNIHAHYDLGNAFYALWLDPTMSYSSAAADRRADASRPNANWSTAQVAKYRRVLEELQLHARGRILEIGCGWGGFAETRARRGACGRGAHPVDRTARLHARSARASGGSMGPAPAGLPREHGQYDAIASIEMFEAVGEAYWPSYFATLKRCLKPGGRACVQTIVIGDALFDRYRVGTDFIQQYVFPGGMLPSPSAFRHQAQRAGLAVVNEHAFGLDYARTLATWRERFHAQLAAVRALGFDSASSASGTFTLPTARRRLHGVRPMSSSSRSLTRSTLVALALLVGGPVLAEVPPHVGRALNDARAAASGRLTWFGLHVYDARLFVPAAGFDAHRYAEQPFALELTYARRLQGRAIAERSHAEIGRLGFGTEAQRARWRQAMVALFPDVRAGQRLAGVHVPGQATEFYFDGQPLGRIDDPAFGAAFFGIWLDARTTAPDLRASLLNGAR